MSPSPEARAQFLNHFPNPVARSIIEGFVDTPDGRLRLAMSLIHPVKLALDYLKGTTKPLEDIDYPMASRVRDYQLLMAIIPPEEQNTPACQELTALATELQELIQVRRQDPLTLVRNTFPEPFLDELCTLMDKPAHLLHRLRESTLVQQFRTTITEGRFSKHHLQLTFNTLFKDIKPGFTFDHEALVACILVALESTYIEYSDLDRRREPVNIMEYFANLKAQEVIHLSLLAREILNDRGRRYEQQGELDQSRPLQS